MTVEHHNPAAADAHADAYVKGTMEISEQTSTFALFMGLTKWGSLLTAATLLLLTVWFAVGAGFLAGAISALALCVIGWFSLRSKPAKH
jgi:hypothetical protein